jgi:DNA-binding XRE family transcriptional regulator
MGVRRRVAMPVTLSQTALNPVSGVATFPLDLGVAAVVTCADMTNHPLKNYRKERSLTRAALARDLDVSKTTIARWEEGKRRMELKQVINVARKTGIPANELRPDLAKLMAVVQ